MPFINLMVEEGIAFKEKINASVTKNNEGVKTIKYDLITTIQTFLHS